LSFNFGDPFAMIAQGYFHLLDTGVMAAKVFADFLVLFCAVSLPALHLDDQFIDRFLQGGDTHIKLVQEKPDNGNGDDLDYIKYILK